MSPSGGPITIRVTTLPGLESFVRDEASERLGRPSTVRQAGPGWVDLSLPEAEVGPLFALRTVHDLLVPIAEARLAPEAGLDGIRAAVEAMPLPVARGPTFRVRSQRRGTHPFTRIDVERAVGGVLHRRTGLPVRLEDPAWIVRADVDGERLRIAHLLTPRALGRRPGPFTQKVGLAPPLAAAAVRLAGHPPPGAVLDPFCGSGTLLVEAGEAFPDARLRGGDWTLRAADGARVNLEAAGFGDRAEIHHRDARALARHAEPGSVGLLLTNPPFGLRIGKKIRFLGFYRRLLAAARGLLEPGAGRVVLLVNKVAQLEGAAEAEGFTIVEAHPVVTGEARPTLIRLEPR